MSLLKSFRRTNFVRSVTATTKKVTSFGAPSEWQFQMKRDVGTALFRGWVIWISLFSSLVKKNKNKKWGCSTDTQKQSCGLDSVLGYVYCGPAEVQLSFKILSRSKARWFLTAYFIVYCSEQSLWDALVLSAASCDFSVTSYAAQALVQGAFHFKFYRTH